MSSASVRFRGIRSDELGGWYWKRVKHFIASGLNPGESLSGIRKRLSAATCQLWVAEDEEFIAACVTEIVTVGDRKVCNVISCGGSRMNEWLDISLPVIEAWARENNCTAMRFPEIRPGWRRVLKDYTVTKINLEKELPRGQHN